MSMHCSSIFPMCTMIYGAEYPVPGYGRVPMCLHLCILPLVACPGFWIGDIIGPCTMVAFPPMCTMAFFWNVFTAPPQYGKFEQANPFPAECPQTDLAFGLDASEDPSLYDDSPAPPSPILAEIA